MAGIKLEEMMLHPSVATDFEKWEKVATVLEQQRMPPAKAPGPTAAQRTEAAHWVRSQLKDYAKAHDGDPGRVTVRRLTSGEYGYAIQDLTGLELNLDRDLVADDVGGEGFTNFGDVQFVQEAHMERYLEVAKRIADYAVIGSGPLAFYPDAGKTGFELSAISRIRDIYATHGFRTVSGEGGRPYGLERYTKAFYAAWWYQHRTALGESNATLAQIAQREDIPVKFAEHIWKVLNTPNLSAPSSEVVAKWRKLAAPGSDRKASEAAAIKACEEIQKFSVTWPSWLFARGDVAAGGAGDERPLVFNDASLKVDSPHRFRFVRGFRPPGRGPGIAPGGVARIYLNAAQVNLKPREKSVITWKNATVAFMPPGTRQSAPTTTTGAADGQVTAAEAAARRFRAFDSLPRQPLNSVITDESIQKLAFGKSLDGSTLGATDFQSEGATFFDVKLPNDISIFDLQVTADLGSNRNQVFRVTFSDRADGGTRGIPVWGLVGDPTSEGYKAWKAGVMEYARILPPNSHGEPTPADKDPVPLPFDSTFNVPEHDDFILKVKYIRDDRFVMDHIIDPPVRTRLEQAWNDLYASFEYHDAYLRLLAQKFNVDLKGKTMAKLSKAEVDALPAEMRKYATPLYVEYHRAISAQASARAGHVEDCLNFASRAWRRPLTEVEKQGLRAFYAGLRSSSGLDHAKATRALIARILVAPEFLYRVEPAAAPRAGVRPLSDWEVASRLSFFVWSSIPDDELRRAAAAHELSKPELLRQQVRRMLADSKARRLSTEFFGQWLGFYRFDQHKGVDTMRFTEFTDDVKSGMYDEAVSFFEYIVRKDRPVHEILDANYTFLNQPLAKHYGVDKKIASKDDVEFVDGANAFHRGGLLRLGAVLTATSAPLRTSPVKRGDWVLRRILGTPTPPPPPDAGSIPADEKLFGGLSLREKLDSHKRNATCAACHTRIDPLGFPLEKYDAVGRWREKYADGKPVDDASATTENTEIAGVDGLLKYLDSQQSQVLKTLSRKLVGYALGRTILASDQLLIERLTQHGKDVPFSEVVAEIVASPQFRNRRDGDGAQMAKGITN